MMTDNSSRQNLISKFLQTRQKTLEICSHIENEDHVAQPMADVSPPKWHLAHSTWFFEELILAKYYKNYQRFHDGYAGLFNSYYKALGAHTLQAQRGGLSRPTVLEVHQYRSYVNRHLQALFSQQALDPEVLFLLETGIHHEQQHQELLYMDIKYILASNVETRYSKLPLNSAAPVSLSWVDFNEGVYEVGHAGAGFAYDNETPRHKHYVYPFAISDSLVTNGDYLAFMADQGYSQPQYWLSQGWDWVQLQQISRPLYWRRLGDAWYEYTLHGLAPIDPNRPLVHISYFEADAFANWRQLRLPTEQELELFLVHSDQMPVASGLLHPSAAANASGEVWCWTRSQYSPYPRFKAFDGLLNEYNAKFMCNQFVLRGGCVATPAQHYRHSYRNFYQPHQRWMFSGIRLAKDLV